MELCGALFFTRKVKYWIHGLQKKGVNPAQAGTKCSRRFTTYERLDEVPFMVVKKDGRREPFNGTRSSTVFCGRVKNGRFLDAIEAMIDEIERDVRKDRSGDNVGTNR